MTSVGFLAGIRLCAAIPALLPVRSTLSFHSHSFAYKRKLHCGVATAQCMLENRSVYLLWVEFFYQVKFLLWGAHSQPGYIEGGNHGFAGMEI